MTISEAKKQANQANAQLSTGPRTEAGKAVSSRNAMTHGLTAKTVLLPGEDPAEYDTLAKGMLKAFNPFDMVEAALAQDLIDLQWRLRRIPALEARFLSAEPPDTKGLNNISLHAARMKRQYSATLKEFQNLHEANRKDWNDRLEDALVIHRADQYLERESTLAQNGFDFTPQFLQGVLDRRKAHKSAAETIREADCVGDDEDFDGFDYGFDEEENELVDEEDELDVAA